MTATTYQDDQSGEQACFIDGLEDEKHREWIAAHPGAVLTGTDTLPEYMVERINETRAEHVITIEDPIEYIYEQKKSMIDQREVRVDTIDFATALRSVFREDVDVIFIGEMRGNDTMATAVTAATRGRHDVVDSAWIQVAAIGARAAGSHDDFPHAGEIAFGAVLNPAQMPFTWPCSVVGSPLRFPVFSAFHQVVDDLVRGPLNAVLNLDLVVTIRFQKVSNRPGSHSAGPTKP